MPSPSLPPEWWPRCSFQIRSCHWGAVKMERGHPNPGGSSMAATWGVQTQIVVLLRGQRGTVWGPLQCVRRIPGEQAPSRSTEQPRQARVRNAHSRPYPRPTESETMVVQPGCCVSTSPAGKSHARSGVRTFIRLLSVRKAFVLFHVNICGVEGLGSPGEGPPDPHSSEACSGLPAGSACLLSAVPLPAFLCGSHARHRWFWFFLIFLCNPQGRTQIFSIKMSREAKIRPEGFYCICSAAEVSHEATCSREEGIQTENC